MNHNKEAKSLTFRRGSEVSQAMCFLCCPGPAAAVKVHRNDCKTKSLAYSDRILTTGSKVKPQAFYSLDKGSKTLLIQASGLLKSWEQP